MIFHVQNENCEGCPCLSYSTPWGWCAAMAREREAPRKRPDWCPLNGGEIVIRLKEGEE